VRALGSRSRVAGEHCHGVRTSNGDRGCSKPEERQPRRLRSPLPHSHRQEEEMRAHSRTCALGGESTRTGETNPQTGGRRRGARGSLALGRCRSRGMAGARARVSTSRGLAGARTL
jgi:hypothetical protein